MIHNQDQTLDVLSEGTAYGARTVNMMTLPPASDKISHQLAPILEIGAGTGNMTRELLQRGYRVVAHEGEPGRRSELQKLFSVALHSDQLAVVGGDLESFDAASEITQALDRWRCPHIAAIVAINVIEHIKNDAAALQRLGALLAPHTGTIHMLVPAHAALFSRFDLALGHYRRYNRVTAEHCLTQAGFVDVRSRYFNAVGALGWLINMKLCRREKIPQGQFKVFEALQPLLRWEDRLRLPFGLSVLAEGKRA